MFETCMVESAGHLSSTNRRWTTAAAFVLESALLTAGVLAALIHTDVINTGARVVHIAPPLSTPVLRTEVVPSGGGGGGEALRQPSTIPATTIASGGPRTHHYGTSPSDDHGPPGLPEVLGRGTGINIPIATAPPPARPRRPVISTMDPAKLVMQVKPVYPKMALIARIGGAVNLHAIVGKDGSVRDLQVLSGHPLLRQAALDAVKQWRYKPTILGGEPVEIETTITVNFIANQ
jgi:periplasmic protein TonB